jgi:hypothetical protein
LLTRTREEADRVTREAADAAEARIAEAEEQAAKLVREAKEVACDAESPGAAVPEPLADVVNSRDELAALLAETEQDIAQAEERRKERQALDESEAELEERQRTADAQRDEAARLLASARESTSQPDVPPTVGEVESSDDDDPAERLSALLEQIVPTSVSDEDGHHGIDEPVDLDAISEEAADEPRPRMAWPSPVGEEDDSEHDDEEEDPDAERKPRESRYRSRSAGLPHLGTQAKSNMTTMANLRKKSRGIN